MIQKRTNEVEAKEQKAFGKSYDLFVVGIGLTDEKYNSLAVCLSALPTSVEDFCIVISMPLDPKYKENLSRMIARKAGWTLKEAKNGEVLKPGIIYITKPGKNIEISGNKLKLSKPKETDTTPVSNTNKFFHSLAAEKESKAIGVILSDIEGTEVSGVSAVKESGGLTIGRLSESKHTKPASAIQTGNFDTVVSPAEICSEIVQYINNFRIVKRTGKKESSIDNIFRLLEFKTGTDFSLYKPSTVMRRIQKRLEALDLKNVDIYYRYITKHPKELDILFATVLIGVTEFFRDKEAFNMLKKYVDEIVKNKKVGDRVRIWVPGCATGEEAYSITILLAEILKEDMAKYGIQIFATDVDEKAIRKGRRGVYPEQSVQNLPANILQKYFEPVEYGYEVKKYLRQLVLFSKHDVTADPPFVKLDLISCRNLLIYFNSDLQKEVLKIFHYALNKEGYLFLGKSESAGTSGMFQQANAKNKIYQKVAGAHSYTLKFSKFRSKLIEDIEDSGEDVSEDNLSLTELAKETLYHTYEHPFVIINDQLQIKEVHGSVRLYLEVSAGGVNDNILKMINTELALDLRALLARVQKEGGVLASSIIKFNLFDQDHYVRIHVRQILHKVNKPGYYLVIFEKVDFDLKYSSIFDKELSTDEITNLKIEELEHELMVAREHLQTFTEELETSNEELQSLNEELQSANEELKSSNEELETSNEELQSANEELHTANSELRLTNQALTEKEEELKKSKEELEKSEQLYRTLAENYPGTIGILNRDLRLEFIAGEGLERFNISKMDVLGTKMFEKGSEPGEYMKIKKVFDSTFKGKDLSARFKYRNRSYVINTIPLPGASGDIDKIMYVTQDVTDMDRLLSQLAETEKRFRNLADTAPVMIWMASTDKKCTYLNQQWLNFTGRSIKQSLGEDWMSSIHPDDREKCTNIYNVSFDTKKPFTIECRLKRQDGEYRWVSNTGIPRYEDEHFLGFIGACSDIHEKRLAEDEIKTSMIYFRSMVDSIPQMAWTAQPDGQVNFFNEKWHEYTGLSGQSLLDDGWKKIVHPHDSQKMEQKRAIAFKQGTLYENELRIKRADGTYRWHIVRALPVRNDKSEILMWVGTCTDIHDQKMVEKNKDEFMNIASHELKTPLTSLKAYIQLIDNILTENVELPEDMALVREYNTKASYSVDKLHELINNLLDVSKIEAGKMKMVFSEIDFDELVQETVKDFELTSPTHKIILSGGKTRATIKGSKARLEQVIHNILSNAVKYSPQENEVFVNLTKEKNFVTLSVKDEGIGLSPGHEKKIFKRFFRVEDSERVGGLGLGLYICKEIINKHDGEIWAESEEGKGTEVYIKFPMLKK